MRRVTCLLSCPTLGGDEYCEMTHAPKPATGQDSTCTSKTLGQKPNDCATPSDFATTMVAYNPLRVAVVEAAALHDLGKAHPQWQKALPAVSALPGGPWAKCRVFSPLIPYRAGMRFGTPSSRSDRMHWRSTMSAEGAGVRKSYACDGRSAAG